MQIQNIDETQQRERNQSVPPKGERKWPHGPMRLIFFGFLRVSIKERVRVNQADYRLSTEVAETARDGRKRSGTRKQPTREGVESEWEERNEAEREYSGSFLKISCCLARRWSCRPPLYPVRHVCQPCANPLPTASPALSLYPADATRSSLTDSHPSASAHPACERGVAGPDTRGRSTHKDAKYRDNFHHPCVTYPHPQLSGKQTHFPLLH